MKMSVEEHLRFHMARLGYFMPILYEGNPCILYVDDEGDWYYTLGKTAYGTSVSEVAARLESGVMELLN